MLWDMILIRKGLIMEFTYTGTIYFDIEWMVKDFIEDWKDNNLDNYLHDYVTGMDDCDYYNVSSRMIKAVKNEMLKHKEVKVKIEED